MSRQWLIVLTLYGIPTTCVCNHFRGAMIYWKQSPIDTNVIDVDYRQSWTRASTPTCDDHAIAHGFANFSKGNLLISSHSSFLSGVTDLSKKFAFQCTDFSIQENWASGKGNVNFTPSAIDNTTEIFYINFKGGAWLDNYIGKKGGSWSLLAMVNTSQRADTGRINQSPRVDMAPVIRLQHGCNHAIRIPVTDADVDDIRCRWAESRPGYDECADVCNLFFHATLDERACTLTYNAQYEAGNYVVAVQIEDFSSPTSNTVLSSIPLQFLVLVENQTSCNTFKKERPTFSNTTLTDQARICVRHGTEFSADIYINSKSKSRIVALNTISPIGLLKSSLEQANSSAGTWHIRLTWDPSNTDTVNNVLCFTAVDENGLSSEQRCITLLAGESPAEILPQSKTPALALVPKTQQQWSIEFNKFAMPTSHPAFIYLHRSDDRLIETIDVSNTTEVTFTNGSKGTELQFSTTSTLEACQEYYFLVGQGLVHDDSYCGAWSSAELNSSFWRFIVESPAKILPQSKTPSSSVVLTTQQLWSIEFDKFDSSGDQPAFIYLYHNDDMLVETIDVSNSTEVTFANGSEGTVLQFSTTSTLEALQEYYFLFGQGLVQGNSYCGAWSSAELNSSFWRFTAEEKHAITRPLVGLYAGIAVGILLYILIGIGVLCCMCNTRFGLIMRRYKKSKIGSSEESLSNDSTTSSEVFEGNESNNLAPIEKSEAYPPSKVELINKSDTKGISGQKSLKIQPWRV